MKKGRLLLAALALAAAGGVVAGIVGFSSSDRARGPSSPRGSTASDAELFVTKAGWKTNFAKHTVPLSEFAPGGPGKDGIPAIDRPKFVSVSKVHFLDAREPVVELAVNGDVRAYPLQILIWHEIVNDRVGGIPVTVTFCPLCNTTVVFDRRLGGRLLDFGTTGNLRNSDLVMYDRQTETWWQQFGGEGVVGDLAGKRLRKLPARIVAWEGFGRAHPGAKVLSRETGFSRPYGQNPYAGYDSLDSPPFFPAANGDDKRLSPKERVVFIERGDEQVVVPFSALAKAKKIEVEVGGEDLEVIWKPGTRSALDSGDIAAGRDVGSADVRSKETGKPVVFDLPFWFAVAAFARDATIVRG
jgi:Protein of unknown function (DUF3179)